MRILLIEDDVAISATLEKILGEQHYVVDVAEDGQTGWELVEAFTYDLILLDVVLPKLNGIEFCKQLRAKDSHTPVLLLTAQSSNTDKVIGFDAGADDYVVKPFDLTELLARIRALLRRKGSPEKNILEWFNLRLNPDICEVTYNNQVLPLTPKEYRLLELFLRNHHRVFSRSAILDHIWDCEEAPQEDTVTVHIKSLRQKLKRAGVSGTLIETVYGQGYRLKQLKAIPAELSTTQTQETVIQQQTLERLAIVWEKYRGLSCDRLKALENATSAWLAGNLKDEQRCKAQQAAHKLAGALGIFGFAKGSQYAREIEEIYASSGMLDQTRSQCLTNLLSTLRELLEKSAVGNQPVSDLSVASDNILQAQPQSKQSWTDLGTNNRQLTIKQFVPISKSPLILVVDDDAELAEEVFQLVTSSALIAQLSSNLPSLKQIIAAQDLDVVLLNMVLSQTTESDLQALLDAANQMPPLPVLFLTDPSNLLNRVKVARLATHTFLQRNLCPKEILAAVMRVRSQRYETIAKIMLVDDDPQILAAMRASLEPLGLQLCTLTDPLQFWQTLENFAPDLLVLDVRMPNLNGLALCRVLRSSYRWNQLPVIFLTAYMDAYNVSQIFAVGANDWLSKTIAEPELVTHIVNRVGQYLLLRGVDEFVNSFLAPPLQQPG